MKSMTGFGRCEKAEAGVVVALQVSSVNRKNLEVICSLPKEFQQFDRKVQERARSTVARGRLQFSLEIKSELEVSGGLPSDEQIDAALARLKSMAERHDASFVVDSQLLVHLSGIIEGEGTSLPEDVVEKLLLAAVDDAMAQLASMREEEGKALKQDLQERRQNLVAYLKEVKVLAPDMVSKHRENLHARLEQAGLALDLDDERVLREMALFADRCDVSEEITRLESHFEQFSQLLEKDEPVGRPLEFLLQEVGREINTTGSKSTSIEVSKLVLEMKNELERIREQVANVE